MVPAAGIRAMRERCVSHCTGRLTCLRGLHRIGRIRFRSSIQMALRMHISTRRSSSASVTRSMARAVPIALSCVVYGASTLAANVTVYVAPDVAPAEFAATEIESALQQKGHTATRASLDELDDPDSAQRIVVASTSDEAALQELRQAGLSISSTLQTEGFSIRRSGSGPQTIWVIGEGAGGSMYGGLELAEQIRVKGLNAVESMDRNPYMEMRGTKFNIPLDVRTPSYSDMSDAAQANIGEVWTFEFWTRYLDALARHRYNYVSLWNLHPFPSMVKVADYPDVALDDVKRSTIEFEEDYPTITTGLVTPKMLEHTQTLHELSIEQKIEFWRRVMQHAKDRNIDFYIITWNIFTYGTGGKYGITDEIDNPITLDYYRKSVRELFRTYPLLRGIGLTTGENMGDAGFQAKEDWAFAAYGQGTLDAAREQPDREIRFIHRQHQTRAQDIARTFAPLVKQPNVDFVFSFKYAQAHALSSTTQTFHRGYLESLGKLKTIWTLRNDDALMFRWGAPDFVRAFIENIPHEPSQGCYLGSDMWVWGREFLSLDPFEPRQLEIERHWYHWMLWGRLGYDPTLDNGRIVAMLAQRYSDASAEHLFDAWQHASMVYPLTTGFHWANFDFQWYIEGCRSRPGPARTESGFHDVNRFITLGTHPGTDNIAIPQYVEAIVAGDKLTGTTPIEVSRQIDAHADAALSELKSVLEPGQPAGSKELQQTLADIRAMALLGKYYAAKIRGATELALFRRTGEAEHKRNAVDELTAAAEGWNRYTSLAATLYQNPLWTNRVGHVDWEELEIEVAHDVEIARDAIFAR